ncbi:hypothetical protein ABK040_005320 [Willaertia magna]
MKQILALLLVALLAAVFVSAQEAEADLAKFRCKALIPACGYKLPKLSPLSDEELADKKWWQPVLSVLGQIGKGAIKDYVNKNWDEIPEEESDLKLNELFVQILPYLKAGVKEYVNNNFDEQSDKFFKKLGKLLKKVGKVGLKLGKAYLRTQGIPLEDEVAVRRVRRVRRIRAPRFRRERVIRRRRAVVEADNFLLDILKGAAKEYVNRNWDNEVESDKFFKKLGKLFKKALPYLKAGVKDYVNNNFDEAADLRLPNPWWTAAKILFTPRPAY